MVNEWCLGIDGEELERGVWEVASAGFCIMERRSGDSPQVRLGVVGSGVVGGHFLVSFCFGVLSFLHRRHYSRFHTGYNWDPRLFHTCLMGRRTGRWMALFVGLVCRNLESIILKSALVICGERAVS